MYKNFGSMCEDGSLSDERILAAALILADACREGQMDAAEELLSVLKAHRPHLTKAVADRLLSPPAKKERS
jgi:hypothetical protein